MQVYDGANWIAASSSGNVSMYVYEYIATANQTTFSGADSNSQTLSYAAGNIIVSYGGYDLPKSDYTATNGTSVVLDDGAVAGEIVRIVAFQSFVVANTYTQSQADVLLAAKLAKAGGTMTGDTGHADNVKAKFGAGDDLQIYHDGSNSYIDDGGTGDLYLRGSNAVRITSADGSEKTAVFNVDGAVNIYYDNDKKLATTATGVAVTGTVSATDDFISTKAGGVFLKNTSGGTGGTQIMVSNTGGSMRAGVESSAGQTLQIGTSPYAAVFGNQSNYPTQFTTNGTTRMTIAADGNITMFSKIGLNNTPPDSEMVIKSYCDSASGKFWRGWAHITSSAAYVLNHTSAGVYMAYGGTSWNAHSDERVKENITPLGEALPSLLNIRCVKYNRIGDDAADKTKVGFIAQDWESTPFSEVVDIDDAFVIQEDGTVTDSTKSESTDSIKSIAYTETIPVLVKAIQEQQATIQELIARIEALEGAAP